MLARFWFAALLFSATSHAQDLSQLQIEKIATGLHYLEGPVWSRDGYLVVSDIPTNQILKIVPPATERERSRIGEIRKDSGGANGNAFDAQARLYSCEGHARRVTRTDRKGKVEVIAEKWQGKRLNAPNDIVVRHDGHVYFTDPAFGSANDNRELDFYGVFHVTPKGELALVVRWQTRPNGIALTADGKTLYVADSDKHMIRAFDLDRAGEATNERVFLTNIDGVPNGLKTDEKGNLYVAANSVWIYTSAGKLFGEIPIAETPSNLAFGGEDFGTIFITARSSVYRTRIGVKGSVQY